MDVWPESPTYGEIVATEAVGMTGSLPHHLEYELPPAGELLFANGHHHESILLFDFSDARRPRLVRELPPTPPLRYPHDFVRLPNRNVLVGFLRSDGPSPLPGDTTFPGGHGGIAELDPTGRLLRMASAADSSIVAPVRPYAFAVLPQLDRLVTTSAAMMEDHSADVVQVWRLSKLELLQTLAVPPARLPNGEFLPDGQRVPFEPRVMSDGRSILLNTYGCGFYRVAGLDSGAVHIANVYTIDVPRDRIGACGVPVMVGRFWIQPVGNLNALVVLDIGNPEAPVEAARLEADGGFRPHWLAKDPGSERLIVGAENGGEERMLMARFDATQGRLECDPSLRSAAGTLGVSFVRERWPHGKTGEAFTHAALFLP